MFVPFSKKLGPLLGACVLAGVLVAGLLYPLASGAGVISNRAASAMENVSSELLKGTLPEVTTMTDVHGKPIAVLFDQYRYPVGYNDISSEMVGAIISIEDRRFLEHDGVDWRGTIRAALTNQSAGEVQQGASTIDQQYIKNYQLLVLARTEADREAAIETTPARKLREIRMAMTMERSLTEQAKRDRGLSDAEAKEEAKKQIVTRYLNVVPFGNNAHGIQAAAMTYFDKPASELNLTESALLAGVVQSTSALDPYNNPEAALERRNLVLDTMIQSFPDRAAEITEAKNEPLGVQPRPQTPTQGCIAANNDGFFCDYALQFLAENGISRNTVLRGGYIIQTTLDPEVQSSTIDAVKAQASPNADGVADVMSLIRPGTESHDVVAMASSRDYGLDLDAGQTVQPQPFSLVGDGAGSVFKIFTVAAAMEQGMGINSNLPVPANVAVQGMGNSGGVNGCPANSYCVRNAGPYPANLSVTQALAQSPNTAFVQLLERVGVSPTVDMAVRLGLRSYNEPGSSGRGEQSLATHIKEGNFGSFTLGPDAVNGLELSNVAATLASGGVWCPPNPIRSISKIKRDQYDNPVLDPEGNPVRTPVPFNPPGCERVVEEGLANTLTNALSQDDKGAGTSAGAAGAYGWNLPSAGKTGTTEAFRSSAFLGYTNTLAGAAYVYNDGPNPSGVCTAPLRQCGYGNVYGGMEPARTWFQAVSPVANNFGPVQLPPIDPQYASGNDRGRIPDVTGQSASEATARLQSAGFKVTELEVDSGQQQGTVVFTAPSESALPGSTVTIYVSNGRSSNGDNGDGPRQTTVEVPGVGPVVIDIPGA